MKRPLIILAACVALMGAPGSGWAGAVEDAIVLQLEDQGFDEIEVSRTFLGRSRITATRGGFEREIVVNPRTGVILRDYSRNAGGGATPQIIDPAGGRPSGAGGGAPQGDDGDSDGDSDNDGDGDSDGGDSDSGGDDGDDD